MAYLYLGEGVIFSKEYSASSGGEGFKELSEELKLQGLQFHLLSTTCQDQGLLQYFLLLEGFFLLRIFMN